MIIDRPIITSLLDDDLYKFTMGAVVFHNFPDLEVSYEFFNRGKTQFPKGFDERLKEQIIFLALTKMSFDELNWVKAQPVFRPTYAEWLHGYRYNPDEVTVKQTGSELKITIRGPWYRTILWEVKLMAIISELYFMMVGEPMAADWKERIVRKAEELSLNNCWWVDMGTRRRRSYLVQDAVVANMKDFPGFIGTSNPVLAMRHKVKAIGTSAHEAPMAMECLFGAGAANEKWLDYWRQYYAELLNVALTDTFTSSIFLEQLAEKLQEWEGFRQDSGDPYRWARLFLEAFSLYGIDAKSKNFVFSDSLTVPKFIAISKTFSPFVKRVIGGIGTNLSNDTFTSEQVAAGWKALNMVIKLSGVRVANKWIGAVKLSDDVGKNTGKPTDIERVNLALGIA